MIELLITIAKLTDRAKFPFVHWDARQTDMPHSGICCWWGVSQLQYDDIWYCSFRWWYTHINGQFLHIFGIRITVQWVVLIQIAVHFILHISHGYCCFCEGFLLFLSFIKVQKTAVQIYYSNILLYFPFFSVCVFIFAKDFLFTVFCLSSLYRLTRLLIHRLLKVVLTMCQANNWFSFSIERHLPVFFGCQWHSDVCLHFYICL